MSTLVVHCNDPLALVTTDDTLGGVTYRGAPNVVYCGRRNNLANNPIAHQDSLYRNPWTIGDAVANGMSQAEGRIFVLEQWRQWLDGELGVWPEKRSAILQHLSNLRGKVLACWCAKPGRPLTWREPHICHGQDIARRVESC